MKKWLNKTNICIGVITLLALVARIFCCFWGRPMVLHPDEPVIINEVMDMLSRHSWESFRYDRPDQFEIKCDAILFTIVSWIKYGMPAYTASSEHGMAFFMLGRAFTALWGTALIPLSAAFCKRLCRNKEINSDVVQISAAVLVAFSSIFVQHSAYVTPDIVLTFFVFLFAYFCMRYIDDGKLSDLVVCAISTGIGITIKYPAAILCIMIAFMIIYRAIKEKKYIHIIQYGASSIILILAVMFVIVPNLFTDIGSVIEEIHQQARSGHLGADGLGLFGNMWFYVTTAAENIGWISVIPFAAGLVWLFRNPSSSNLSLLTGAVFWFCLSVMPLHWVRWGIPMYIFYFIVTAIGIGTCLKWSKYLIAVKKVPGKICLAASCVVLALLYLNSGLSAAAITKLSLKEDTRLTAAAFCEENGITKNNCFYEGYTPFAPYSAIQGTGFFFLTDEGVNVKPYNAAKNYFMMSSSFSNRYYAEPERYKNQIAIYSGLNERYKLIYEAYPDGNYIQKPWSAENIVYSLSYLINNSGLTGNEMYIYEMQPEFVSIASVQQNGQYLSITKSDKGSYASLSSEKMSWCLSDTELGGKAFGYSTSSWVLDWTSSPLFLSKSSGAETENWELVQDGNIYYIVNSKNMALTCDESGITLSEFVSGTNQQWIIETEQP